MAEQHELAPGSGGQWEVTHYREQIRKRTERGDDPKVVEALHRKLARAIEIHGDPDQETK